MIPMSYNSSQMGNALMQHTTPQAPQQMPPGQIFRTGTPSIINPSAPPMQNPGIHPPTGYAPQPNQGFSPPTPVQNQYGSGYGAPMNSRFGLW